MRRLLFARTTLKTLLFGALVSLPLYAASAQDLPAPTPSPPIGDVPPLPPEPGRVQPPVSPPTQPAQPMPPPLPPLPPASVPPLPPGPPSPPVAPPATVAATPPPILPATPPPITGPAVPALPPPGASPQPLRGASPPQPPALPSCEPPPGWKGDFKPAPNCVPAKKKNAATLSHAGQFVLQLSMFEIPYLFSQVTARSASDSRTAWLPTIGLGFGSASSEVIFKFGGGINSYADDRTFMFGIERRHFLGSGTVKGVFSWNLMFGAGGAVTFHQMFNIGLGLQIDPSRRWGIYAMVGPGFLSTFGGDSRSGGNNYDVSFILMTSIGVQARF